MSADRRWKQPVRRRSLRQVSRTDLGQPLLLAVQHLDGPGDDLCRGGGRDREADGRGAPFHASPNRNSTERMARLRRALLATRRRATSFRVANRLWGQKGYEFLPEFLETHPEPLRSGVGRSRISPRPTEDARQAINQWVEKQTEEKIKDLLPPGVLDAQATRLGADQRHLLQGELAGAVREGCHARMLRSTSRPTRK